MTKFIEILEHPVKHRFSQRNLNLSLVKTLFYAQQCDLVVMITISHKHTDIWRNMILAIDSTNFQNGEQTLITMQQVSLLHQQWVPMWCGTQCAAVHEACQQHPNCPVNADGGTIIQEMIQGHTKSFAIVIDNVLSRE